MSEEIQKITKKLKENKGSLHITDVPIETKESFRKLAKEEFMDHYGFALKWLVEGLVDRDMQFVLQKFEELENKIFQLESKKSEAEEKKGITLLDGRRIGGRKNVKNG